MAAAIPDLVDIFRWDVQVGEIEHNVVAGIFRVLHGAKHGVCAAAEHDLEGPKVGMPFVSPR
jgi:hypothetical protein